MNFTEQYIAIIGNSGSGKSTLAAHIARGNKHVLLDLDTIAWKPTHPPTLRDSATAAQEVVNFCNAHSHWIIEGCYADLIQASLTFQPKLVFLDPGLQACLSNCNERPWEPTKYASKQQQDENLAFLLEWVSDYYQRDGHLSYQAHQQLFDNYAGVKEHLRTNLSI